MAKLSYTIIVEKGQGNYGAYAPDLPGCVAVGDTVEETIEQMKEAIEFHLEGMRAEGLPIPKPQIIIRQVDLEVPAA
jgi:predicted RNase H-like HicB family nuclease